MTDYCIWIVTPRDYPHSRCFNEVALCLQSAFQELGHVCPIVSYPIEGHTHIALGAHLLFDTPIAELPKMIIYNLEQIIKTSEWLTVSYLHLLRRFPVWDYSPRNIAELDRIGVSGVKHLPVGYADVLLKIDPLVEKDIDILFYGSTNPRRQYILQLLKEKGHRVYVAFNEYGHLLDGLISRSKIVLNLHFYENNLEIVRCSYLMANAKCVVTEFGLDKTLEEPYYEAMAFCSYDDIVNTCAHLLGNDSKRHEIGNRGFEIFSQFKQVDFLKKVLA